VAVAQYNQAVVQFLPYSFLLSLLLLPILLHAWQEDVLNRKYTSLVKWNDGHISGEIVEYEIDEAKNAHAFVVDKQADRNEVTGKVSFIMYGQQVARDGEIRSIGEYYHEFDDVNHLFAFPKITVGENTIYRFGMKDF